MLYRGDTFSQMMNSISALSYTGLGHLARGQRRESYKAPDMHDDPSSRVRPAQRLSGSLRITRSCALALGVVCYFSPSHGMHRSINLLPTASTDILSLQSLARYSKTQTLKPSWRNCEKLRILLNLHLHLPRLHRPIRSQFHRRLNSTRSCPHSSSLPGHAMSPI